MELMGMEWNRMKWNGWGRNGYKWNGWERNGWGHNGWMGMVGKEMDGNGTFNHVAAMQFFFSLADNP